MGVLRRVRWRNVGKLALLLAAGVLVATSGSGSGPPEEPGPETRPPVRPPPEAPAPARPAHRRVHTRSGPVGLRPDRRLAAALRLDVRQLVVHPVARIARRDDPLQALRAPRALLGRH